MVTAHWEERTGPTPETFEVTFDPAGGKWKDGSMESKTQTVESGQAATAPEEPTRDGFTFDGWDTDFNNVTTVLTVKAQWKANTQPEPPTPISIEGAKVVLSVNAFTYNGEVQKPVIETIDGQPLHEGEDYTIKYTQGDTLIEASTGAGTYTLTITGKGGFSGSTSTVFTISKAAGTLTAKGNDVEVISKTTRLKKVKKISAEKTYTIGGSIGELTFSKVKAKKKPGKFVVNAKTGKIKVKKGLKRGKYKLTVLISDPGDNNHEAAEAQAIVTIKIRK